MNKPQRAPCVVPASTQLLGAAIPEPRIERNKLHNQQDPPLKLHLAGSQNENLYGYLLGDT